jgi:4-amino-4-deoxy-L-arabinose transferase-like glycosyltransferase
MRTGRIREITQDTYEAASPPLYHVTGAGALKLLGLSPPFVEVPPNPDFPSQQNNFLHTPAEDDLPFRGPVLSIHLLRAISTFFGAGTVVVLYLIVRALFPGRPLLAWSAGANTALLPQFAFVGGAVMNDTAVIFFTTLALYACLRLVQGGSWRWVVLASISLSCGFLIEGSTIVAATVCALAVMLSPHSWRRRVTTVGLLAAVSMATAGWFYIANLVEYGEIFPINALREVAPFDPALPLDHPNYRGHFQTLLSRSYWFVGGPMRVYVVDAMYQFLDVVAGMALAGAIVFGLRHKFSSIQKRGLTLLFLLLILTLVEVTLFSVRIGYQPQARYLFIALPATSTLLALGLISLFQRDTERDNLAAFLLPAILFGLNVGILTLTLPTVY